MPDQYNARGGAHRLNPNSSQGTPHEQRFRRDFLRHRVGLGGAALAGFLPGLNHLNVASTAAELIDPLAPRHRISGQDQVGDLAAPEGAPAPLDLYDYKPELQRLAGQPIPASFLQNSRPAPKGVGKLFVAKDRTWKQYGSSAWFSNLLPNLAQHADKLTFIKSSVTVGARHLHPQAQHRGP